MHGAWADASGWNEVIRSLQAQGYPVVATANPLRGLSADSAYLAARLKTIKGPLVLAGHSYGGAVITNAVPDHVLMACPRSAGRPSARCRAGCRPGPCLTPRRRSAARRGGRRVRPAWCRRSGRP
ncbi:alpha/beta fold hydrolase [Streptomyces chlorus]|uniref:Alpha/beta fold hydrolase n=1 Tax=Streptomyces chlorus TaxID=887452 RepID=A0ABW1DYZ7_9ACTN